MERLLQKISNTPRQTGCYGITGLAREPKITFLMLHRLILKVTKLQLSPSKHLSTVVKNILFWEAIMPPPPCQIGLKRNYFKFCQGGFQSRRNRKLIQIFDIVSTTEDMTGFSQLLTNFTLTLIILGIRYDIKNLNNSSVSTQLKSPWKKFKVVAPY